MRKLGVHCFALLPGLIAVCTLGHAQQAADNNAASALRKLDGYVERTMQKTGVPGVSVAVVYQDQVVYLKGFGVRQVGRKQPVDADTVFQIASFSKPIATTVVAGAVSAGKVSWDDRIRDLDPDFELSDPAVTQQLTVRDLLSHRSSLPEPSGDTLESLGYSRPEILRKLRLVPLRGTFRKTYQYSNFGITEGALAATRSLGAWEQVSEELLYSKLGMTHTSSRFTDYFNQPNRATPHYFEPDGTFKARYLREADAEAPAGGVSSSARDLAEWLRLQLAGGVYNGEQVVQKAALEETHKPVICRNETTGPAKHPVCPGNQFYGLGWDVDYRPSGEVQLSHSGAFMLGAATTVYMIPEKHIGILVLTNGAPVGLPESVALSFLDDFEFGAPRLDYYAEIRPKFDDMRNGLLATSKNYSTEPARPNPLPGAQESSLVGTYANPYYGKVEVEQQEGKLILRLPPRGAYYELTHWNGDTYTYYIANESSGAARRGVRFNNGGRTLVVENLAFEYSNVFERVHP